MTIDLDVYWRLLSHKSAWAVQIEAGWWNSYQLWLQLPHLDG